MTVNRIEITADHLVVEPVGLSRVWSFTRRLRFPLAHVRGATFDPGMRDEPKGLRGPGLRLGGRVSGTFRTEGARVFWNVSGYDRAVVITLADERFDRIVVSVDDPDATVEAINTASAAR